MSCLKSLTYCKGDISIVGPRPMVPNTFQKYSKEAQVALNKLKPGLTGVGSIIFRDEEKFLKVKKIPNNFMMISLYLTKTI